MAKTRTGDLAELATEVRQKTLQILAAAGPAELLWSPPGTANHILWHAGHALWLQDVLCLRLITGKSELPHCWAALFGMGARPDAPAGPWPHKEEIRQRLEAQLQRVVQVLQELPADWLDSLPPHAHAGDPRTLFQSIAHALHDEANHQGEMYLLLKMQRPGRR